MLKKLFRKFSNFNIYSNKKSLHYDDLGNAKYNLDNALFEYPSTIKTFLEKRYINKEEIWPKIYKLDIHEDSYNLSLDSQKLCFLRKLKNENELKKEIEKNYLNIQYIISCHLEPHFKELIDEYLKKIYINGQMVPMKNYKKYLKLKEECMNQYKRFFFGDDSSDLEIYIENKYLTKKIEKYQNFINLKNLRFECILTKENLNRFLYIINFKNRNPLFYDDFKPLFKTLNYEKTLEYDILYNKLNGDNLKYNWKKIINSFNWKKSFNYINKLSNLIHARIEYLLESLEFVNILNIPPDFHIKISIYNIHIWMIYQCLTKINTPFSNTLATQIINDFNVIMKSKIDNIFIKKKEDFIKDIQYYMDINRKLFEKHFVDNLKTSRNPYKQIDALVWTSVFFEKVDRYENCVYLMSEYIIKNWEVIQKYSIREIENLEFDFDVFLMPIDYKSKIISINPPLSKEEMEQEENNKKKKYKYNSNEDFGFELPLDYEINNVNNKRIQNLINKFNYLKKKFENLNTYDYFNELEENEKKKKLLSDKYMWNFNDNDKDLNIFQNDNALKNIRKKIKE